MSLLRFKPLPKQTLWGGDTVKNFWHYDWMPEKVGQAWAFAAQENESNECISGKYKGMTLKEIWEQHSELFGNTDRTFPVIVSMLGPVKKLSIQVHPTDEFAKRDGYPYGKNEIWYFFDAEPGAKIVFGHNAKNEADLRKYISEDKWEELINHLDVHPGDTVYIPAGILHACCENVCVYEVQQSTDLTYRFYDYKRPDANGNLRELHVEKAIETLNYNQSEMVNKANPKSEMIGTACLTTLIDNLSFTVKKLEVKDTCTVPAGPYELVSIAKGKGFANGGHVEVGDHFLLPKDTELKLEGEMLVMMTTA